MGEMDDIVVTIEQEIQDVSMGRPHVVLLGAGASRAALPKGDKNGKQVPLLKEVAENLQLVNYFPDDLKNLSTEDFEAAYSQLYNRGQSPEIKRINSLVHAYFLDLKLPEEPNLYDTLTLSLRSKDVIATFNWDPFLLQSRIRLAKLGITTSFPKLFFLHGNVLVGFCEQDNASGLIDRLCSKCGQPFKRSALLYPVENKDYQNDAFIKREWDAVAYFLKECGMFTVFGYSAPATDKEAIELLKAGWGDVDQRAYEQTEVINRPGADEDELRRTWSPFIHSHHYDVFGDFYDSFIANHPRRSMEAYWNQYFEAKFITPNPVPKSFSTFGEMAEWYRPLLQAEAAKED